MPTYEFTIFLEDPHILDGDALLDFADRIFDDFEGDVTPAISAGEALVECTMDGPGLEEALRRVIQVLNREGLTPRRVEMDADSLTAA